jgi:predicted transposase/invertase (TIGR01784 family)
VVQALEKAQAILYAEISSFYFDGKKEGREEGLAEGKASTRNVIAKVMLEKSMTHEIIAECTGLTVEYVKSL